MKAVKSEQCLYYFKYFQDFSSSLSAVLGKERKKKKEKDARQKTVSEKKEKGEFFAHTTKNGVSLEDASNEIRGLFVLWKNMCRSL